MAMTRQELDEILGSHRGRVEAALVQQWERVKELEAKLAVWEAALVQQWERVKELEAKLAVWEGGCKLRDGEGGK
jgi:hypothetical protein